MFILGSYICTQPSFLNSRCFCDLMHCFGGCLKDIVAFGRRISVCFYLGIKPFRNMVLYQHECNSCYYRFKETNTEMKRRYSTQKCYCVMVKVNILKGLKGKSLKK